MMRPVGTWIGLRDEQLLRVPGDNLDVYHQPRDDIVAYEIRETVYFLLRGSARPRTCFRAIVDAERQWFRQPCWRRRRCCALSGPGRTDPA